MLITCIQVLLKYQKAIPDSTSTEKNLRKFMNNIISKYNYWDDNFYKNNCIKLHSL